MKKNNTNTRIIDLTLGELLDAVEERVKETLAGKTQADDKKKRYVYGLKGLAKLFGCSKTTASRIKTSGKIDRAITQIGALLIIDADLALTLAGKQKETNNPQK